MTLITCIPRNDSLYLCADKMVTKGDEKTRINKIESAGPFLYTLSGTVTDYHNSINFLDYVKQIIVENLGNINVVNFHTYLPSEYISQEDVSINIACYYENTPQFRRIRFRDQQEYTNIRNPYFQEIDYVNDLSQGGLYTILAEKVLGLQQDKIAVLFGVEEPLLNKSDWGNKHDLEKIHTAISGMSNQELQECLRSFYQKVAEKGKQKPKSIYAMMGLGLTLYRINPDNSYHLILDEDYD